MLTARGQSSRNQKQQILFLGANFKKKMYPAAETGQCIVFAQYVQGPGFDFQNGKKR